MSFQSTAEALAVLGLDYSATKDEIKSAYHRRAAYIHPDAGKCEEEVATGAFLRLREAYDYLMDAYDKAYVFYPQQADAPVPAPMPTPPPKIIGNETTLYTGGFSVEEGGARTIGGDAAMWAWKQAPEEDGRRHRSGKRSSSDEALSRKRQEERSLARKREKIRQRDEEFAAITKEDRLYEEAMMRIHAIRAAEIAAKIINAM